jgi:very-short-patch-repair endonuclease
MLSAIVEDFSEDNYQYPIGKYSVDFKIGNKIIEVFGNYFHNTKKFKHVDKKTKDDLKIKFLNANGYEVLVVYENDIINNAYAIATKIRGFCEN